MIEKIFSIEIEGRRYTRQRIITLFGKEIRQKIFDLPQSVMLDVCTLCQLKCPSCYMRVHDYCGRGAGWLSFGTFKKFLDKHKYIKSIEMSNNGEIFLNPDLLKIMEYAYKRDVKLTASTGVNFNNVSDEVMEGLVKYQVKALKISADGATQKVYSAYRIGGDFDTVMSNIKKLISIKKKNNSRYPEISWQYIIMPHNVADIPRAKAIAKELGVRIWFKLSWDTGFIEDDTDEIKAMTGLAYLTRSEYEQKTGRKYFDGLCRHLWANPVINYDGTLLGCDCEPRKDYGVNVFKTGLKKAMKNKVYTYSQEMLRGKVPPDEDNPCADCAQGHYRWRLQHGYFFSNEEIERGNREDYYTDDSIFDALGENARIAIFGTHDEGIKLQHKLQEKRKDVNIVCFLDSFRPGQIADIPVYHPLYFSEKKLPFDYVIITFFYSQAAMRKMLGEIGISDTNILERFVRKENVLDYHCDMMSKK